MWFISTVAKTYILYKCFIAIRSAVCYSSAIFESASSRLHKEMREQTQNEAKKKLIILSVYRHTLHSISMPITFIHLLSLLVARAPLLFRFFFGHIHLECGVNADYFYSLVIYRWLALNRSRFFRTTKWLQLAVAMCYILFGGYEEWNA